jgi:hypothetical protein
MRLSKNRKGMTGIVDAMIFITIMTLVFSAMYMNSASQPEEDQKATDIVEELMSVELRVGDVTDIEDIKILSMSNLLAAAFLADDYGPMNHVKSVLDVLFANPDMYSLEITYEDCEYSIGTDREAISECTKTITVMYGGELTVKLKLY